MSGNKDRYKYWIYKSEPNTWSWGQQVAKGDEGEGWDGVRNHQASNNMKAMEVGDLGFFYHSVNEKRIVGGGGGHCALPSRPYRPNGQMGHGHLEGRVASAKPNHPG